MAGGQGVLTKAEKYVEEDDERDSDAVYREPELPQPERSPRDVFASCE